MAIPKQGKVIAIDGPAGTGKSSATKRLADSLSFIHVDTGALYRAVAFCCVDAGLIDPGALVTHAELGDEKKQAIAEQARKAHLEFKRDRRRNPSNRIFVNGKDVTSEIRTPEMSMAASWVSAIPEVRAALLGLQRQLGCSGNSILEGRDIGTVIFPDADIKFFMVASVEERAKRRLAELEVSGADAPSFEEVKAQIAERDQSDMNRKTAPLKKAEDAIVVDTTDMTLDEVVAHLEKTAVEKLKLRQNGHA